MKLELEVISAGETGPQPLLRKTFDGVGGVIGRGAGCDWTIPDSSRLLSSHHGLIACREGRYFLTDISTNGIDVVGSSERLQKGLARLISNGDEYRLGSLRVSARLTESARSGDTRLHTATESIPDDAFRTLDPIRSLDLERQHRETSPELEALAMAPTESGLGAGHSVIDRDHLVLPRRAESVQEPVAVQSLASTPDDDVFWAAFGAALGIRIETYELSDREALAIKVARLFRLGFEGLNHSLRTCDELKSELDLPLSDVQPASRNPLKDYAGSEAGLSAMLAATAASQLPAERIITQAYRYLQTHQVALLAACRSTVRSTQAVFSPGHLLACFHTPEKRFRFSTDGGRWRAYQRYYQRLIAQGRGKGHPSDEAFAKAYEEQVRLISTLHVDYPG
ncbi:type VI secretion system-associated FHA domain protein TagH [Pseudomonas tolaasii]|uniref:Type VI secretion system-associated FHA domain protein TagH n=2 Tax=Pseudomonas tolaasii TaxID=29442 RepID=A0A7Y8AQQ7_PSETO|nr:type VI secretion system-associated FHA domain protein TagH [Pseudomonas tolaasii]ARB29273.1 type VI secretion protein [Pseudomonas tolaasii]KAB0471005.1 type VI secretion system-associated FHA domain protein TagH [Pseudomonas tolaasii]MBY8939329.1 type VI secretion system-associated FHA domain protein TagH [Pseudomonas tolaasii]NWC18987.1 type VI secretion system-associated FHA domain protein TagH [Pseudomonas tolaasii]NWC42183.1 type VI secretion system-associated FHA domain protein TagH 